MRGHIRLQGLNIGGDDGDDDNDDFISSTVKLYLLFCGLEREKRERGEPRATKRKETTSL